MGTSGLFHWSTNHACGAELLGAIQLFVLGNYVKSYLNISRCNTIKIQQTSIYLVPLQLVPLPAETTNFHRGRYRYRVWDEPNLCELDVELKHLSVTLNNEFAPCRTQT